MRDYIELGSCPCNEDCVAVGSPNYHALAQEECRKYIKLLREKFGPEPEGAQLAIVNFPHDFGSYYEVVCHFDESQGESVEYAYYLEANLPSYWVSKNEYLTKKILAEIESLPLDSQERILKEISHLNFGTRIILTSNNPKDCVRCSTSILANEVMWLEHSITNGGCYEIKDIPEGDIIGSILPFCLDCGNIIVSKSEKE